MAATGSSIKDRLARILRLVGLVWIGFGVIQVLAVLLENGAPEVLPDRHVLVEVAILLAINCVPGAFLMHVASRMNLQSGRRGADLARMTHAIGRMADAKAYAETQGKPHGVTSHGTRAGVIRAAENPTVTGRSARKSVIQR